MARPRKLDNLKQIDGKVDKQKPTTLEQLWGGTGGGEYGTLDEKEYESKLDAMNLTDLQKHALEKGLIPKNDEKILKQRLMNLFASHVNKFKSPPSPKRPNPQKIKEAIAVLSLGKN